MRPASALGGHQPGGLVQTCQRVPPRVLCRVAVLGGQPLQVGPVARRLGQFTAVQCEQLAQEHLRGPAVEQHVVAGEDQPVLIRPQADQQEPQQRRAVQVERAGALLGGGAVHLARGQVHVPPRQCRLAGDHLHGAVQPRGVEARAQVRVTGQQGARGLVQPFGVEAAFERDVVLHRVHVGGALVVAGVEDQPLLQRGERQEVDQAGVRVLKPLDLALGQADQWQVRGGAARPRRAGDRGDLTQRREPALGQLADLPLGEQLPRPGPGHRQPRAVQRDRVDLQRVPQRSVRVGAAADPGGTSEPAEVVEAHLRGGQRRELRAALLVEVAQRAEPGAAGGKCPQLFLDALERLARVAGTGVEQRRVDVGEPADGAVQVQLGRRGVAAVPLQVDQHGSGATPPAQREGEPGEQHVVHPAVHPGRCRGQQRFSVRCGQSEGEFARGGEHVAGRVERPLAQWRLVPFEQLAPERQLLAPWPVAEQFGPAAERDAHRRQLDGPPVGECGPRRVQVLGEDPPRHPVHDQVVQHESRFGAVPLGQHHNAVLRAQFLGAEALGRRHGTRLGDVQRPVPGQPRAQYVVPVEHGLHASVHLVLGEPLRHA